jgi:hypothetical protein
MGDRVIARLGDRVMGLMGARSLHRVITQVERAGKTGSRSTYRLKRDESASEVEMQNG